jgi:hypothetical protein
MLNNIKNSPLPSRQRLDEISHHFLGDSSAIISGRRVPFFLPILVDEEHHKNLVLNLNNELIKKGASSCIVNANDIYTNLKNNGFFSDNEHWSHPFGDINNQNIRNYAHNITIKHILNHQKEDIYLLPYTFSQSFLPVIFGKAVIIIASTLDEIRSAYGDIKNLNKYSVNSIGTIMTYKNNPVTASLVFSKLNKGVKKFLNFDLHNSGYIKIDNDSNTYAINTELDEIEIIIASIISRWNLESTINSRQAIID